MLLELRIGNLALAQDVVLRPGPGLTVLTGETGAGKSLIAGALLLLAGGQAARGMIRRGEDTAWVEAVCDLTGRPDLQQEVMRLGLRSAEDGLLVIRRELRREGRGRVLINGELSSLSILEAIAGVLFVIQSQHQQRELMSPGYARDFLDDALGLGELRRAVDRHLSELRQAQGDAARRRHEYELACAQEEIWRYQHEELTAASLDVGEEDQLAESIAIKRHEQALQECAATALARLESDSASVREMLGAAMAGLRKHAERSQRISTAARCLETAADQTADACTELERFLDGLQFDTRGLSELQERKALYEELRRKYRKDLPGLLKLRDQLGEKLDRHDHAFADLEVFESKLKSAKESLESVCCRLRDARREGASGVAASAEDVIQRLALPGLELSFSVEPLFAQDGLIEMDGRTCKVEASGADDVRIVVRTNPGESVGEVGAIASGGELARIYLGLTLLRRSAHRPLVRLFDEVDAGLGMDAATPVAWVLSDLAKDAQAICITHLPTVAVHGAHHWRVYKEVHGGRTTICLAELDEDARVLEIARQLGGEDWQRGDAAAQLSYARELLGSAGISRTVTLKQNTAANGSA